MAKKSNNHGDAADFLGFLDRHMILRASRIERSRESRLGHFRTDAATLKAIGDDHLGVLVTRCEAPWVIIPILRRFDEMADISPRDPVFLVMSYSKELAAEVKGRWDAPGEMRHPTGDFHPTAHAIHDGWASRRIVHGTVESVRRYVDAGRLTRPVAAMILLDPSALVQKARGFSKGDFKVPHDRPNLIADMQESLKCAGWTPPLFLLTQKGPREIDVDETRRAYRVEAFIYLDGKTLCVGK